jgi:ribonuclease R
MLQASLPVWGEQLSALERRAERAERLAIKSKQIEFMESRLGQVFHARIANVTNFGFFVELQEHFIEGLVRAADLADDYYRFEERLRYLAGVNTGREFRTGQVVLVRATQIDRDAMRVLFTLHAEEPGLKSPARRNPPRVLKESKQKHGRNGRSGRRGR